MTTYHAVPPGRFQTRRTPWTESWLPCSRPQLWLPRAAAQPQLPRAHHCCCRWGNLCRSEIVTCACCFCRTAFPVRIWLQTCMGSPRSALADGRTDCRACPCGGSWDGALCMCVQMNAREQVTDALRAAFARHGAVASASAAIGPATAQVDPPETRWRNAFGVSHLVNVTRQRCAPE